MYYYSFLYGDVDCPSWFNWKLYYTAFCIDYYICSWRYTGRPTCWSICHLFSSPPYTTVEHVWKCHSALRIAWWCHCAVRLFSSYPVVAWIQATLSWRTFLWRTQKKKAPVAVWYDMTMTMIYSSLKSSLKSELQNMGTYKSPKKLKQKYFCIEPLGLWCPSRQARLQ